MCVENNSPYFMPHHINFLVPWDDSVCMWVCVRKHIYNHWSFVFDMKHPHYSIFEHTHKVSPPTWRQVGLGAPTFSLTRSLRFEETCYKILSHFEQKSEMEDKRCPKKEVSGLQNIECRALVCTHSTLSRYSTDTNEEAKAKWIKGKKHKQAHTSVKRKINVNI